MTPRSSLTLAGLLLAGSGLFPVSAAGQQGEEDWSAGFPTGAVFTVRDTRDISTFEQLAIIARRAFAPLAPLNVTPLQAYGLEQACDDGLSRHSSLRGPQYGPAALVLAGNVDAERVDTPEAGTVEAQAWYFRTPYEAISTARDIGWCNRVEADREIRDAPHGNRGAVETSGRGRYFATTYPIDMDGFGEPDRRFMSMEAGRIDEYLRELERPESDAALTQETLFWESIRDSGEPADFKAYLVQWPNGTYAPLARNRLEGLRSKGPATRDDGGTTDPRQ